MATFEPSEWSAKLRPQLNPGVFSNSGGSPRPQSGDLVRLFNLWIAEGIPFCFQEQPIRYELVRELLAERLDSKSRNISLCGCARIGFSLSPAKFPRGFSREKSDLDIFVVDEMLFANLAKEFQRGINHWRQTKPQTTKRQEELLNSLTSEVPKNLNRGFIDSNKVPTFQNLPGQMWTKRCELSVRRVYRMLDWPDQKKHYIRVYKSWDAASAQNVRSIQKLINSLA